MPLTYGGYTHTSDVIVARSIVGVERDGKGLPYMRTWRIAIEGRLYCSTEAAFMTAIGNLTDAYSEDGLDLKLEWPDETNTDLDVDSSTTLSGVRVIEPPHCPRVDSVAYAPGAWWPYKIALEWTEELIADDELDRNVIEFSESCWINNPLSGADESGAAPPRVTLDETITGYGVKHAVCEKPKSSATQSGRVVGWFSSPAIPAPLWPEALMCPVEISSVSGPEIRHGTNNRRYGFSYSYRFESSTPLEKKVSAWPTS